jgi:hypothetical protein
MSGLGAFSSLTEKGLPERIIPFTLSDSSGALFQG